VLTSALAILHSIVNWICRKLWKHGVYVIIRIDGGAPWSRAQTGIILGTVNPILSLTLHLTVQTLLGTAVFSNLQHLCLCIFASRIPLHFHRLHATKKSVCLILWRLTTRRQLPRRCRVEWWELGWMEKWEGGGVLGEEKREVVNFEIANTARLAIRVLYLYKMHSNITYIVLLVTPLCFGAIAPSSVGS
jgi:hypothetical protein